MLYVTYNMLHKYIYVSDTFMASGIPWQVSVRNRGRIQFCGGTLISTTWIVSAANCITKRDARDYFITVGHDSRGSDF